MQVFRAVGILAAGALGVFALPEMEAKDASGSVRLVRTEGPGCMLGIDAGAVPSWLREQLKLSENSQGIIIRKLDPNACAAKNGLKQGDIITSLNNQPIIDQVDFIQKLRTIPSGQELRVDFLRAGKPQVLKFVPEQVKLTPDQVQAQRDYLQEIEIVKSLDVKAVTPEQRAQRQQHLRDVLKLLFEQQRKAGQGEIPPTTVDLDEVGPIILQMRYQRPYVLLYNFSQKNPIFEGFIDNEIELLKAPDSVRQRIQRNRLMIPFQKSSKSK